MEKDYLKAYLSVAPVSLALIRAIECRYLSRLKFEHPILDVGCGEGLFASILFDEQIEQGIDISPIEIGHAENTGAYKNVAVENAMRLPFKDGSFATIFSNGALEHMPLIDNVLQELNRVLKKGGKLIFTVPSDIYGEQLFYTRFFNKIGLRGIGNFYKNGVNLIYKHRNLHDVNEWKGKIESVGLKLFSAERYFSSSATKIHDFMFIFSLLSVINKRCSGDGYCSQRFAS